MVEYNKIFLNEDNVEVEIRIKAECSTHEDMRRILGLLAQNAHSFYLEVAEKINNTL